MAPKKAKTGKGKGAGKNAKRPAHQQVRVLRACVCVRRLAAAAAAAGR